MVPGCAKSTRVLLMVAVGTSGTPLCCDPQQSPLPAGPGSSSQIASFIEAFVTLPQTRLSLLIQQPPHPAQCPGLGSPQHACRKQLGRSQPHPAPAARVRQCIPWPIQRHGPPGRSVVLALGSDLGVSPWCYCTRDNNKPSTEKPHHQKPTHHGWLFIRRRALIYSIRMQCSPCALRVFSMSFVF